MNRPIVRLFGLIVVLFALLIGFTTYWSVLEASELRSDPRNRRPLIAEQGIRRGEIRTADGVLVATNEQRGSAGQAVFVRRYPEGEPFGHPVGYSFVEVGRSGIELSENGLLTGESNEFASILEQLEGRAEAGADLTLTVDSEAQRVATDALAGAIVTPGTGGAVVAIEPATGAVRAMASVPGYDPNEIVATLGDLQQAEGSPLVNRATQSLYPPGSTMKVVTAAAALDSGRFEPTSIVDGSSPQEFSGVPLQNFGNQSFGQISLTDALTNSVNTAWANVAEQLGAATMFEYMERFGFFSDPPLGYPDFQMAPSGVYESGRLVGRNAGIDVARVGIGQERLLVTPIQMAMVAAAVANEGTLMEPTFVQEATGPDGRTIEELDPEAHSEVMSPEGAAELTEMMTRVTQEGTAAGLSVGGAEFAGKTGTAEIDLEGLNQPWFVAFAPADDPQVAVAATVERVQGGSGGAVAGPIATAVMEELLR